MIEEGYELDRLYSVSAHTPENVFDTLRSAPTEQDIPSSVTDESNKTYQAYMKIHKVLVGNQGADTLEQIHGELASEQNPRYLSAAGWAAAETALIGGGRSDEQRLSLLDSAKQCWTEALSLQKYINAIDAEGAEHAVPHRLALDVAVLPLFEGLISGKVDFKTRQSVFEDCLNIAQLNAIHLELAARDEDSEAVGAHVGFGYECNALLAFNRHMRHNWFVTPATARSDSGVHHRNQTHDLMVVQQENGRMNGMIPIEIKSKASARDRRRYKALLVRGKMHLSMKGKHRPTETLEAITATYEGTASQQQTYQADEITERFMEMIKVYRSGQHLGYIATERSLTKFYDNSHVVQQFAGLGVS